jgi:hypothetical protein
LTNPGQAIHGCRGGASGALFLDFLEKASQDQHMDLISKENVIKRCVQRENVRAVLGKVVLGEADAGIVSRAIFSQRTVNSRISGDSDNLNILANYYLPDR